jgi:glycerol-3-phosphate acyltransferase PlsY
MPWPPWTWIVLAYLVAAIPVALLVGFARGVDLRETGSGNIGATNAMRVLGKGWGLTVLAMDVAKAAAPVWVARELGGVNDPRWLAATALAAVCGHIFPIYLRFRGGKGVACALGTLLVLAPPAAATALLIYLAVLARTRVSALGSLSGVTAGVAFVLLFDHPQPYRTFVIALWLIIWWRHRENLRKFNEERRAREDQSAG